MPVKSFSSHQELLAELQAALISSVEAVTEDPIQLVPATSNADEKLVALCWTYAAVRSRAESMWWLSEDVVLWWTEGVTVDHERVVAAAIWVDDRGNSDEFICCFNEVQDGIAAVKLVLLSEDKAGSAMFRTLFDL